MCADPGGCTTQYMSPLGLRYPEWLGTVFYGGLVVISFIVILIPAWLLDPEPRQPGRLHRQIKNPANTAEFSSALPSGARQPAWGEVLVLLKAPTP